MYPVDTIKTRMQALAHPGQRVRSALVSLAGPDARWLFAGMALDTCGYADRSCTARLWRKP